ncbi:hypothetical protein EON65_55195 [archaeon]|nr:MAG: hypothetical protein EON65_55195 [archaeon]
MGCTSSNEQLRSRDGPERAPGGGKLSMQSSNFSKTPDITTSLSIHSIIGSGVNLNSNQGTSKAGAKSHVATSKGQFKPTNRGDYPITPALVIKAKREIDNEKIFINVYETIELQANQAVTKDSIKAEHKQETVQVFSVLLCAMDVEKTKHDLHFLEKVYYFY